jgi:competence protein ComEC
MLDVGHGLAVVIETHRHRLLYDTGPSFPTGYDSGTRIVVPALSQGRRSDLDILVVSHADNDHSGGVGAVVEAFPSVNVLKGPDVTQLNGDDCVQGQQWEWDGVRFEMLHPSQRFAWRGNESSCVLKMTTAHGTLLITGDAESRAERVLAADPAVVGAEVVVVGHHGSATSSRADFVAATGAKFALVSAGYANRWGFPRPEVARRWKEAGAELWVTGDAGALSVSFAEAGISVAGRRHSRRRYWRTEQQVVSGASDRPRL